MSAEVGDKIVYHVGEFCGGVHRQDALFAHNRGLVRLFAPRVGEGRFEYMAVRAASGD